MPKPYAYLKLVQRFEMAADQSASMGLGIVPTTVWTPSSAELQDFVNDLEDLSSAWFIDGSAPISGLVSNDTFYVGNSVYYYPANATAADLVAENNFSSAIAGGSSYAGDLRQSMVSSTLTGLSGRSFRGRRYLPVDGATLSAHQFSAANIASLSAADGAFLHAINEVLLGTVNVVCSIINNRDFAQPITAVSVDSKPDTQRRRSNKEVASHINVTTI